MAVEFKDYYKTLGVSRSATDDEIRKAFRKLARQYHPDVARDKKTAEAKFKEINEAYEVLGDSEKRQKYDQLGAYWKQGGAFRPPPGFEQHAWRSAGPGGAEGFEFHVGGTGFSEFFERFFGGTPAGGFGAFTDPLEAGPSAAWGKEARRQRGQDIEGDILVTLGEALSGAVREISLRWVNPGTRQSETRTIRVRIPPGVEEGQRIRVAGQGGQGVGGGEPGHIYLRARLAKHPDFRVRGCHLYYDLDLAPWEAVLGASVLVPTLEGQVTLRIPPGTTGGQQLRLRGRGLPRGSPHSRGDLLAVVHIQVPSEVDPEERSRWEQLAEHSRFKPRKTS